MIRKPADCTTKAHIRTEIDRLDGELVALLTERFAYVQRMAELKTSPDEALVPERVDEVIDRVAAAAKQGGLDEDLTRDLWRLLIEWNIEFERRTIARRLGQ
ncbi:chorismate mutase [Kaistia terrae]|jgi:isochorismate pyruvate lyase|uniref:chorismate mutase n=1 Tax=Kaistia terrae TaxID=537017 RepID=A0ABW0Q0Q1_9HYPH|nr:chorismate mutase [Kaistia terrae]MCX5578857.1 chorismate mutase [Kaistia terrae]